MANKKQGNWGMYKHKRIALADKDGDIFKIYPSITTCANVERLNHTTITNYIKSGDYHKEKECYFLEADEKTKIDEYYEKNDFF